MRNIPFAFLLLLLGSLSVHASTPPKVLASIKPLQLIAQAILGEVSPAQVLLPPGASPHHYSMRPSDMVKLHQADVIIWLGDESEYYLAKPLKKLAAEKPVVNLAKYLVRGVDGYPDPHLWLSSKLGIAVAKALTEQLSEIDHERAGAYRHNLSVFIAELAQLDDQIRLELREHEIRYLVYHDAYRYFEQDYGLAHRGIVSLHPEINPGAKHLLKLQRVIENERVQCIIAEPQSNQAVLGILRGESELKLLLLDPLGEAIAVDQKAYAHFLRIVAETFKRCQ